MHSAVSLTWGGWVGVLKTFIIATLHVKPERVRSVSCNRLHRPLWFAPSRVLCSVKMSDKQELLFTTRGLYVMGQDIAFGAKVCKQHFAGGRAKYSEPCKNYAAGVSFPHPCQLWIPGSVCRGENACRRMWIQGVTEFHCPCAPLQHLRVKVGFLEVLFLLSPSQKY